MRLISSLILLSLLHTSYAQTTGCTDPLAYNYNANATANDGSCLYDSVMISPVSSFDLDSVLIETSGLIYWQNKLWTHNDDTDNKIYALDTLNGDILSSVALNDLTNMDWEEIAQDDDFIYIGDFGNNVSGNRTNLRIYKISKQSILQHNPIADTIAFSYADQIDFISQSANTTDFDCEAFIVTADSIYLFTKQWVSNQTHIYVLPKTTGTHLAQNKGSIEVDGLITGSVLLPSKQLIALSGYSQELQPFVYLLYDFHGNDFSSGNKRKIQVNLPFHQVEGITTGNGLKFYLTNEAFNYSTIDVHQQLHILDLKDFLLNYVQPDNTGIDSQEQVNQFSIFPNPASEKVTVSNSKNGIIVLRDLMGKRIGVPVIKDKELSVLDLKQVPAGIYVLCIQGDNSEVCRLVIRK